MPVLPKDYEDLLIAAGKNPANYVYDRQNDTVVPIEPDEPGQQTAPGVIGTIAREAGVSVLPSLAAGAAGAYGAGLGSRMVPEHPIIGGAAGALSLGLGAGISGEVLQSKALEHAAPEFMHDLELGRAAHPGWAAAGQVLGSVPGFGSPLRGLRTLMGGKVPNAISGYLANTGLQGALNLGTAAVTGNLGNMTGEEKRAMFFETLAGGLQHGGPLTRKIAAKYAPALNEYMKTGDKAGALTPEQRAAKMAEGAAPQAEAKGASPTEKFQQVVPYSDEEIGVIMNADEWSPPNPTPHDKAISKGKADGILQTPEDYTRILQSTTPDAELRGIYMQRHAEKQAQMTPEQRYAQSREAITEGELKAREEFTKQLQGFGDERKSLDDEIKLLDETPIPPGGEGTRMAIKLQKVNKLKELMDRQLVAEQEYAARWPTPEQPFNPGPLPGPVQETPPVIDAEAYDQRLLPPPPEVPMIQDIPSSPFGPAIPLPEQMPTAAGDVSALRAAGETQSPLERAKLSPDTTPLSAEHKAALQGYAEGEQRAPFGSDGLGIEAADVPPPKEPTKVYGGLPVYEPLQKLWGEVKEMAKKANFKLEDITILPLLWRFTKQTQARFAEQNPLGAIVAANMPTLYHRRDKIAADKINTTELFKDFLGRDEVKSWLHNQTDGRTWDTSTLPKELQSTGEAFINHVKSYIDDMKARNQKVMRNRGNAWEWRDPEHVDGYFPWSIDRKIWAEITEGGPKAAQRRKEWIDNWKKFNPGDEEADAEAAFDALIEPISAKRVIGGEPVFNQFRRTHGVPVPKEWRDNNIYESLQTYNRNYGVDAAWTEVVQSDPLMRRAFGIKRDQAGNDTSVSDKSVRPTKDQWTAAFREADRVGARWANEATPDMDLGTPLLDDNNGNARSLLASYSQRPMYAMTGIERAANSANQVAGALMLQTLSGVRDVSQALASTAEYMTGPGKLAAVKALARAIVSPTESIRATEAAGAMQKDVFAHQGEEVLSRAVYKAVRGVRGMTGRNFLDQLGKAITYSVAHDTVEWQLKNLGESPLAKEFGPVGVTDHAALAEGAAAALVQRSSPSYDARNLPAWASPQTRSFLGHLFSLSTWGIARFNNWMVDSYLPLVRNGSFERFIASLGFGILGAAATQSLTSFIRQKKPADLSWQEWMGLSTEDQQKEFAPMLFALMQAQGTIGIAGDLAAPIVKAASGKTARLADIEPQMPAVIMGKDVIHTLADFTTYAGQREHLDKYDAMDLIHELAKSVQLYRDLQKPLGIDTSNEENARERRIYEGIEKKSAVTGNAIAPPLFQFGPIEGGKFSLSKAFNQRGVGSGLEGLMPDLIKAAQQGRSVNVKSEKRTDDYYQNMARRVGLDDAKHTYERDVAETDEDQLRKQLASRLRSLRPR